MVAMIMSNKKQTANKFEQIVIIVMYDPDASSLRGSCGYHRSKVFNKHNALVDEIKDCIVAVLCFVITEVGEVKPLSCSSLTHL